MTESSGFVHSLFSVQPGKQFHLEDQDPSGNNGNTNKKEAKKELQEDVSRLSAAQELLWADGQKSVLIIFQAMDAAGKDGTIKHVMSGVNPQGCDVHSFKAPSDEEKKHHFLWRPMKVLPEAGRIAIFNRSYYEEVLVVRVHPEFLEGQVLHTRPGNGNYQTIWEERYQQINDFERYMTSNGTAIIKFFLNVSKDEQKKRFLERLEDRNKNWKFSAADIRERAHWDEYMTAYEEMLNRTSTEYAPWYVIPADKKWLARMLVADIITSRIESMDLHFPHLGEQALEELEKARKSLKKE